MIDLQHLLNEALTIPPDKAGLVELKLRDILQTKYKDFKQADTIVKCCRNDEKSGKMTAKELTQTYVIGLGNIIDLFKVYDRCKDEYLQQGLEGKKVKIERADGKVVELDPLRDLNKIGRLPVLKQFIDKFEKLVKSDTSIQTTFAKYAINEHDRKCIRLMCWNSNVMVWGTKEFEPSQKFAVQLWQNIETIDSGSAYGDPEEQCPYCTHSKNHWDSHADGDPDYEQYWYLKIPEGVTCSKRGDLNVPEVVKIYNVLKGLGPDTLICQHDSEDDWCDREDNPISEYGIDIHDAGETVYIDGNGEAVDPDDYEGDDDLEKIEFSFGPGKQDYYDDVVELYDKWFTRHEIDSTVPKQPWETDRQYNERKSKPASFVKYVADIEANEKTANKEFDFESDVWTHSITLKAEHFKDGILAIQLPQIINNWLKVEDAEIASFAGLPRDFIGHGALKELKLVGCKIKSTSGWNPSDETKNGLRLVFSKCILEDSFKLGDVLEGASLQNLVIDHGTSGAEAKTVKDFKFLSGSSKLKSIAEMTIGNTKLIESFEGLAKSLEEGQKIQRIFIQDRGWYGDGVQINSFRGLPNEVERLTINQLITTQEAIKELSEVFPKVSTKLNISIKNIEQEILIPVFKAVWTKAQDSCELEYKETGQHIFDTLNIEPIFKTLKEDKTPSRFNGLQRKKFASSTIYLDLSPRNMYEERSFLSSDVGFSGSGVFDSSRIPLFQNENKLFVIRSGRYNLNDRRYAMVQDGKKIVCFSPSLDVVQGPFTKQTVNKQLDSICLDSGQHGPDFDLDEALKVFLATRKTDFPETKTLHLMDGFTGKVISNIDEPDLTLNLSRGGCPNLIEISRCKLAAIQDERGKTLYWDDKKTFVSQTIYRDCIFSEGGKLEARAIHNCTITQSGKDERYVSEHTGTPAIDIFVVEGIFNSKLSSKSLTVRVKSPVIEGCDIESGSGYIKLNDLKKLASTRLAAKSSIELRITEDFQMTRDCRLESSTNEKMDEIAVNMYTGKAKIDPTKCDEIASTVASCLRAPQVRALDLYQLSISSLKFLEALPSEVKKIQQVYVNLEELKDFRFKLSTKGQVDSLGYPQYGTHQIKDISKDATLDGFDASVMLSLGYYQRGSMKNGEWPSKVVEQFDKYFTQYPRDSRGIIYAMGVDPNYIDKNGQFAAPKTLDERLFGHPTTTEENNWLRVMKLFD